MGYPYFNPPGTQKQNMIERGDYFVPTDGSVPETVTREYSPRQVKARKARKIAGWIIGIIVFVLLGIVVFSDYFRNGVF